MLKLKFNLMFVIYIYILFVNYTFSNFDPLFENSQKILIYDINNKSSYIKNTLKKHRIKYEKVNSLDTTKNNLYIIFDAADIPFKNFPKNYIIYQSLNFLDQEITRDYRNKLYRSIAIWEPNFNNIKKYSKSCTNYYYFPDNYEFEDPMILPCLLPTNCLSNYKQLLSYSNKKNTDISSHIPILYCYSILQNPNLILELGVRSAESTKAFSKSLKNNTNIIGIDIHHLGKKSYAKIKNSQFFQMDDISFSNFWQNQNPNKKMDIIFIDTSHLYAHTFQEISQYLPLLNNKGLIIFHDSNMCPLQDFAYNRLNNTSGKGWNNEKGVIRAIKDFFSLKFDQSKYNQFNFVYMNTNYRLIHYPFCNGLTLIKKHQ